jgi:hypothetical protein
MGKKMNVTPHKAHTTVYIQLAIAHTQQFDLKNDEGSASQL